MREELLANYLDQYVAVYQGVVVDYDHDQIALLGRVDEQYPDKIVLMRKVTPHPRKILHMRSPRFVRD